MTSLKTDGAIPGGRRPAPPLVWQPMSPAPLPAAPEPEPPAAGPAATEAATAQALSAARAAEVKGAIVLYDVAMPAWTEAGGSGYGDVVPFRGRGASARASASLVMD